MDANSLGDIRLHVRDQNSKVLNAITLKAQLY